MATKLQASKARHVMLYGGSRSGKSVSHTLAMIVRAAKVPSRHVCLRLNFNHIKTSLWMDTFPKILNLRFPDLDVHFNKTDYYIQFPNGSEIWMAGLDNGDRVEKILGKEYSTLWFNECSQIPLESVNIALTRLAEKNELSKKCYYDMNPPTKRHWSYWLFRKHQNPITSEPVEPSEYVSLLMNPMDNMSNIDENYLHILNNMSPEDIARFRDGEFSDGNEGMAYYSFDHNTHVQDLTSVTTQQHKTLSLIGMDFNVDPMTAIVGQLINGIFYITEELYENNSDTHQAARKLVERGYAGCRIYPDSTGTNRRTAGQSDRDILANAGFRVEYTYNPYVADRVNNINRLFAQNRIIIDKNCKKLINDLEKVTWLGNKLDQKGANKHLTHISDALGYLCWAIDPITKVTNARIRGHS